MQREQKIEGKGAVNIKRVMIFAAAGIVMFYALLSVSALVLLKAGTETEKYKFAGYVCASVAGIVSGYLTVIKSRRGGLVNGFLTSFASAVPSTIILLLIADDFILPGCLVPGALMIFFGSVGGILAANIKKKSKF